ncbi:hypothetical protein ILYODFUR_010025 [Ilyodon furcidens]|uniref:Uncharacterized protein n=1 Tax=Ilyodon furcidens TaxID=33524 RepID=A0ABV0UQM7_9TELE
MIYNFNPFICPFIHPSPFVYPAIHLSIFQFVHPSLQFALLFIHQFYPSICSSVCPSLILLFGPSIHCVAFLPVLYLKPDHCRNICHEAMGKKRVNFMNAENLLYLFIPQSHLLPE